jgi:uncharacterized membrane protein YagU involved in acid resistance
MHIKELFSNVVVGMISGYVGTKVMEPVSMKLYEWEPEAERQQEDRVRPGPPFDIAARKITTLMGLHLSDAQVQTVGTFVFHYGLGMSWGVVYTLLRRRTSLNPLVAGVLDGASLSLLVDEGLAPLLGFTAPDRAYPLITHLRGFVAHLVYGLSVAGAAEGIAWLGCESRARRD